MTDCFFGEKITLPTLVLIAFFMIFSFYIGFLSGIEKGKIETETSTKEEALKNNAGYWIFKNGKETWNWGANPNFDAEKKI